MHHLILGTDISTRDKLLAELKSRILKTPDALKLDLAILDGNGLDMNVLKAALLTAPAVSAQRLVVISRAEKLDDRNLVLIDDVIVHRSDACVIVLEAMAWDRRNAWRKGIAAKVKVIGGEEKRPVFDLFDALWKGSSLVLDQVQGFFDEGDVQNIVGALRWWWANKVKGRVPAARYKKGLLVIQEADERIKLSGLLHGEQALEVALVKLSLLLKA